ncbi:hypothetical protein IQB76_14100 [Leptospira borgpetersenii serovar Hardjo-bovis]|uniref:LIC_20245 family lipoprotein n=1 Tax=Leptospira borgpetersenii TaxID=174 RepID=UPI0000E5774B|nr:hypothetical protein [Leptospira borgpetersenii]ABJ78489.1 Conserved hypothetical protein [Leptospira borgpetersenii serovar Hardjo-bovis str. L550]AMX57731.1 hypothetical protein LBK6_04980 [Leptospira borgpetersenii serovar Hardjo]AMX60964.1 hypothetical protein LBK9_04915 [Leptospira borgpetersenii serovar Hardjo]AMX64207.1 hypothetical protein LBK30_04950 [Leptospira borgpetersenii serovar Hardjo]AMX67448.1 hypothetical protein LBHA_04925 [Leptospira borgpetersenii serovar Hardjo]
MVSIRKLVLYSGISIVLVVLVWILFSSEDSSEKEKKSKEADSVALLLGGGGRSSSSSGSSGSRTNESIFDSSFYKAGKGEYVETEKGEQKEADPDAADADNPINPQTNKPYTNEEMERFSQLRERFPNNSLVPKKLSPAEKEAKKQKDNQVAEAARNVYARTASPAQIRLYYNHMEKQTLDRMDIINYLVDLQKGSGDEETEKKLQNIQDSIKNQLQQVQKDKENAFQQAGL